jgi:hypothetical protein
LYGRRGGLNGQRLLSAEADGVAGQCRQIAQQRAKAVHGIDFAVAGLDTLGGGLALRCL